MSKSFQDFFDLKGIKRELTSLCTPSQNGVAKHMNRTIQERICSMLSNANLPNVFWAEEVAIAVHVINRLPNKKLDSKVIEEIWYGKPPSYKHLKVFGCEAFCHVPKHL